jgi:hypothetical protein
MTTVYVVLPGTKVSISASGGDFKPQLLRGQLQFPGPAETTDTDMVFAAGKRRIRVARVDVVISRYNGQYAENQFGA